MKISMHRRVTLPLFALLAAGFAPPTPAADYVDLRQIEPIQGDAAAGATKAAVCTACHGPNGNAIVPNFPRLAGQRADFLYHRLDAFKHADPKDPYIAQAPMLAIVAGLNDIDLRNLAAFFAAQAPTAPAPPVATPAATEGEAIFKQGDPARGVPPCAGCHGADANGVAASDGKQYLAWPALRGQHAAYVVSRLNNFRNGLPNHSSNDFIMHSVARTLDDSSIQAVAAWLASLPPQPTP
ncbi:MAG: c-type cytochrome [Proteobacteria bacterium]|uniref:c-type cytochrome n=1 Tax=Rudaea sp. TaxID=2136325 RepID=UPI00321FCD91|nr:c-type cytochrome [Pseudomonadota bacterium]